MSVLLLILCAGFFGVLLLLVTRNSTPVDVDLFFFWWRQVPLSVLMPVCILSGVAFSAFLGLLEGWRLRRANRRLHRRVQSLEDYLRESAPERSASAPTKPSSPAAPVDYPLS